MTIFFRKFLLALNKFLKSKWFVVLLIACAILLLVWFIIPGISIFGFSILQTTFTKIFTTLLILITTLVIFLYKKNKLNFSSIIVFFAKRKKKNAKKLNLTNFRVKAELKNLVTLIKKRKKLNNKHTPIYAILGEDRENLDAILRHSSKKSSATNDSILLADKYSSKSLSWNISNDKVLISLFNVQNFYGLFKCLYDLNNHYPINGIIYTIDLRKMFESKDSTNDYQKKVQTEIFELRKYLEQISIKKNVKIPVYITLTGMEVISGFNDYFSLVSEKIRNNPFGVTLPINKMTNFTRFKDQFKAFLEELNNNIIIKCDSTLSSEKILNVITFTKQVLACLDAIEPIIERLLDNKTHKQACIRGVYFTSYKNTNFSFDFMRKSIIQNQAVSDQKIYFLDNLFDALILKEVYSFGENTKYINQHKYKDYTKSTVVVLLGFFLSIVWIKSSLSYVKFFDDADAKYNKILNSKTSSNDAAISFAHMINKESRLKSHGLYYNHSLKFQLTEIYKNIILVNFLPQLESDIGSKLQSAIDKMPTDKMPSSQDVENLHTWLAVYLMLVDNSHFNKDFFVRNIKSMWAEQKISPKEFSDREELLEATIISGFPSDIKLNKSLLFNARDILRTDSTYVLAYQMLKDEALEDADNQYTLLGNAGDINTNNVFDSVVVELPTFYTKMGYYNLYIKNQIDYLKKAASSMWVLSDDTSNSLDNISIFAMKANMDVLYWNDYLKSWTGALEKINILDTSNINSIINILNNLTIEENSIMAILKRIVDNTDFISMGDVAQKVGINKGNKNIVTSKYNEVIRLLSEYKKSSANKSGDSADSSGSGVLPTMSAQLVKIRNALVTISLSSQPNLDAFGLIEDKQKSSIFKDLSELWEIASNSPQPIKKWASQIVNTTTRVLDTMAVKEINARWKKGPFDYYNSYLKGRYPIKIDSYKESSVKSFIEFFKKDGVMDKFMKENLSELIEKSSNSKGYVWKKYYGESFAYDEEFLGMINSLNIVKEMFFSDDGTGFKLFLTPNFLDNKLSLITISFDNKSFSYANGPQEDLTIKWPASNVNKSPVTVSYTSKENDTNMINFDGEWGLFRFLEQGGIKYNQEKGVNKFNIYNDKEVLAEYTLRTSSLDDVFNFDVFKKLNMVNQIDNSREVTK